MVLHWARRDKKREEERRKEKTNQHRILGASRFGFLSVRNFVNTFAGLLGSPGALPNARPEDFMPKAFAEGGEGGAEGATHTRARPAGSSAKTREEIKGD